ncbi:MAG TPA: Gldg family protein, partial [Polyangiaceae bacterium]|nr:Gldg family protein [Polyangiaceae bacterium]
IFGTFDRLRYLFTGLGVLGAVFATVLRFVLSGRRTGERRAVERTLALFSLGGLVALVVYFATTETGRKLFGIAKASAETRARVDTAGTILWVVLVIVAVVPLLFGERALAPMRRAPHIEARRVRAATIAGLSLALAATYCALFTYAAGELDLKADYSYFRTARAGESTKNIVKSLTEPLKVTAFYPQLNEVGTEVEGYLRDLAAGAPNFQVEVQDRLMVPALAKEAKVTQDGVIVLQRAGTRELVTIGSEMKTAAAKLKSLDVDFQKALLKVMRSQRTAYLTVAHGEVNEAAAAAPGGVEGRTAKGFRKLLESQNYVVKDLGLAQGLGSEIPPDAFLVVVLGPSKEFLPEEIGALKRYADRGGKLFLGLDPDGKADLSALADVVDLTWDPVPLATEKNLVRRRYNPSDRGILVTTRYSSHASVSTLSRNAQRAPVIFPNASQLDKKQGSDAKVDFVIKSLPDAFTDANGNFEHDKETEKTGTYNLAAAVSKPAAGAAAGKDDKQQNEMRAFVMADADAATDAALGHEPNIVLVLDALRWLGGEESFSGAVSSAEDVRIEHTKEKDLIWFYATIFGAPAVVLAVGLGIVRRTRRSASGRRA